MKEFIKPELRCLPFTVEDVLTLSSAELPPSGDIDPLPTIDEDEGVIV
ncbi:MAG: hypothetical protein IJA48_03925 [Oscillospiraceae bacterium]|nr:hypothetical protein [Oscillospiraceae bacterium]